MVWVFGIKAIFLLFLTSCSLFSPPKIQQEAYQQEDISSTKNNEEKDPFFEDENVNIAKNRLFLSHPKISNAWNTKRLVLTEKTPSDEILVDCSQEMIALTKNIGNPEELLLVKEKIHLEIKKDPYLYHWCFYKSMIILDDKLLNDDLGLFFEIRNKNFLNRMRALWLLAVVLDRVRSTDKYFKYMRRRYIQLSKDFFGRDIVVVSSPFQGFKRSGTKKMTKPAEAYKEE